ncbi:hypothetical protein ACLX1H_003274 [Fusarium chlamydosporum]
MPTSRIFPRMDNVDTDLLVAMICAMIFICFLGFIVYWAWKPRPDDASVDNTPPPGVFIAALPVEADLRESGTGCNLPFLHRRPENTAERNTFPLETMPGREHPRDGAN